MGSDKLSLHNISVDFDNTPVLKDISFSLRKGRILAVVGPSGCGKSTLLNVLSGVIKNYKGEIVIGSVRCIVRVGLWICSAKLRVVTVEEGEREHFVAY